MQPANTTTVGSLSTRRSAPTTTAGVTSALGRDRDGHAEAGRYPRYPERKLRPPLTLGKEREQARLAWPARIGRRQQARRQAWRGRPHAAAPRQEQAYARRAPPTGRGEAARTAPGDATTAALGTQIEPSRARMEPAPPPGPPARCLCCCPPLPARHLPSSAAEPPPIAGAAAHLRARRGRAEGH
jgi:hypothetical protein